MIDMVGQAASTSRTTLLVPHLSFRHRAPWFYIDARGGGMTEKYGSRSSVRYSDALAVKGSA